MSEGDPATFGILVFVLQYPWAINILQPPLEILVFVFGESWQALPRFNSKNVQDWCCSGRRKY